MVTTIYHTHTISLFSPSPPLSPLSHTHTHTAPCHNESDLGQTYTGDNDLTQSFLLCLPWSDVADGEWVKNFPELEGSFCRNPGQLGERPWCFTTVSGAWEYCNVSLCSGRKHTHTHTLILYGCEWGVGLSRKLECVSK